MGVKETERKDRGSTEQDRGEEENIGIETEG